MADTSQIDSQLSEAALRELRNLQSDDSVTKLVAWHRLVRLGLARMKYSGGHFVAFELTRVGRDALASIERQEPPHG